MIDQMSPISRRIVALGLLVLTVLVGLQYVMVPLVSAIVDQRDELAALRARDARLRASMKELLPEPSRVSAGSAITAPNVAAATQRLQALLAGAGATSGVVVQFAPPCRAERTNIICLGVQASGAEINLARFLRTLERGTPLIRFPRWQIAPGIAADNQLHFFGQAELVWEEAQ